LLRLLSFYASVRPLPAKGAAHDTSGTIERILKLNIIIEAPHSICVKQFFFSALEYFVLSLIIETN
jgi:hypothetical protein